MKPSTVDLLTEAEVFRTGSDGVGHGRDFALGPCMTVSPQTEVCSGGFKAS